MLMLQFVLQFCQTDLFSSFLIKFMDQAKAKRDQGRPQRSETEPGPHRGRPNAARTRRNPKGHRNMGRLPSQAAYGWSVRMGGPAPPTQ